jgi:ABC-type uncharacterized transport system permease subunit
MFESLSVPRRPNWKLRMVVAAIVPALVWGIVWLLRMTQMPLTSYGDLFLRCHRSSRNSLSGFRRT